MEHSPAIAATLAEVGPRLKRLRTGRGVALAVLSEATGISKSTLSRLETGGRRPSLELLLPIARAHRVPLDELVGAPPSGDPRVPPGPAPGERQDRRSPDRAGRQPCGLALCERAAARPHPADPPHPADRDDAPHRPASQLWPLA